MQRQYKLKNKEEAWKNQSAQGRNMNNKELYVKAFVDSFQVEESTLPGLKYMDIPAWDSVGHMSLIVTLEDAFDIMMDTDDIIELSSFEKGMEILSSNYDVEF